MGETRPHRQRVVLVTIDPKTGMVTGTRMLQSTGSKLLDGAALEAYSKWRFKPGGVPQVKMPIEFASRPRPQPSKQVQKQPAILYVLLIILLGLGAVVSVMRKRKTSK
jgi:TonB family protein